MMRVRRKSGKRRKLWNERCIEMYRGRCIEGDVYGKRYMWMYGWMLELCMHVCIWRKE